MSPQWKQRYDEVDRLAKEGVIRIVQIKRPNWTGDPQYAFDTQYVRTCPHCQTELTYKNVEYMLTQIGKKFCRVCWRENPDLPRHNYKHHPRNTDVSLDFPVNKRKGYADIYIRVSCLSQVRGDGLRRQENYCIEYCQEHKIKIRHIIQDVCSAYSKDNCVTGNLGFKMRDWEAGKEPPPRFLVFENMDRFSRQEPFTAMAHIQRLKDLKIKVVITGIGNDSSMIV